MLKTTESWRAQAARRKFHRRVANALRLNRRGEARPDGLSISHLQIRLEIEWRAREVHPWDRDLPPDRIAHLFAQQCFDDAKAALERLFTALPEIELIDFKIVDPKSAAPILTGSATRTEMLQTRAPSSAMKLKMLGAKYQLNDWRFEPLT